MKSSVQLLVTVLTTVLLHTTHARAETVSGYMRVGANVVHPCAEVGTHAADSVSDKMPRVALRCTGGQTFELRVAAVDPDLEHLGMLEDNRLLNTVASGELEIYPLDSQVTLQHARQSLIVTVRF